MHARSEAIASADYAQYGPLLASDGSHASRCMCDVCCPPQPTESIEAHVCADTGTAASDVYTKRMAARLASTKHPTVNLYTKVEHDVVTFTWTGMSEITVAHFENNGAMTKVETFSADQEIDARYYHEFLVNGLKPKPIKIEDVNDAKSFIAFLDRRNATTPDTSANGPKAREVLAMRKARCVS